MSFSIVSKKSSDFSPDPEIGCFWVVGLCTTRKVHLKNNPISNYCL